MRQGALPGITANFPPATWEAHGGDTGAVLRAPLPPAVRKAPLKCWRNTEPVRHNVSSELRIGIVTRYNESSELRKPIVTRHNMSSELRMAIETRYTISSELRIAIVTRHSVCSEPKPRIETSDNVVSTA